MCVQNKIFQLNLSANQFEQIPVLDPNGELFIFASSLSVINTSSENRRFFVQHTKLYEIVWGNKVNVINLVLFLNVVN